MPSEIMTEDKEMSSGHLPERTASSRLQLKLTSISQTQLKYNYE